MIAAIFSKLFNPMLNEYHFKVGIRTLALQPFVAPSEQKVLDETLRNGLEPIA